MTTADVPAATAVPPEPIPTGGAGPGPLTVPAPVRPSTLTYLLVGLAASLYCLDQLKGVLMPFLVAVLVAYAAMPAYAGLQKYMRPAMALVVLGVGVFLLIYGMGRLIYGEVLEIYRNLPAYQERVQELTGQARRLAYAVAPALEPKPGAVPPTRSARAEPTDADLIGALEFEMDTGASADGELPSLTLRSARSMIRQLVSGFANLLLEAVVVGFYVILLLEEGQRLPGKIRAGFTPERAVRLLAAVGRINIAVHSYLSVKVKASLFVAVPATVAMWSFGVTGAVMWGVLTFFGRFLPYVGSLVTCALPVVLAFAQEPGLVKPAAFALVLVTIHGLNEYVIEPSITGHALGISPLVILVSLAFWSTYWGVVGMCLAVPLTAMIKIALENVEAVRPYTRIIEPD